MARTRPPRPFCSTARCCARGRSARGSGGPVTFLLDRVAEDMAERLQAVMREFHRCRPISARRAIAARARCADRVSVDHARVDLRSTIAKRCRLQPESLDLAVSALAFQFVNDLPGVLAQIRRALKPDGLLLAAMIGGDTLTELGNPLPRRRPNARAGYRRASRRSRICAMSARCCNAPGFALPVTDVDRVVVRYDNAFALMQDLRRMGATNMLIERRRTPTRRATHAADGADLRRTFCRSGRPHPRHLRCDLAVRLGAA